MTKRNAPLVEVRGDFKASPAFHPLDWTACFMQPAKLSDVRSWQQHIPFAFWLTEVLKPSCFVELGTHKGDSYLAFCQAVSALKLSTRCYAVDTWQGDEHAGLYDDSIYDELSAYHNAAYGGFSRLLRMTFDEAAGNFADQSVDLLHIDGLHNRSPSERSKSPMIKGKRAAKARQRGTDSEETRLLRLLPVRK